jgi:hypothetical protein
MIMKTSFPDSVSEWLHRLRRFSAKGTAWIVAVGLLFLGPLFTPSVAAAADTTGNWNLDDGSGHRLGAVLYERSNIDSPAGLRLRLNAESDGLKLDHARPLMLSDGDGQDWRLTNRSKELMAGAGGAIPVGSSQYDAGCLDPIPSEGVPLQMSVASSAGDLSFALSPGQVQTLHSLTDACAN